MKIALILLALSLTAGAQRLPDDPTFGQNTFNRTLMAADAAARMNDAFSTWEDRPSHCAKCYEKQLPQSLANSLPGMIGYGLVFSGALDVAAAHLWHRGHHRMARLLLLSDIGIDGFEGTYNYRLASQWGESTWNTSQRVSPHPTGR